MRYEFIKLTGNRFTMLLCAVLLVANVLLFNNSSESETLLQVREKYNTLDTLEQETAELSERIDASFGDFSLIYDANLLTGNIYDEYMLNQDVLKRVAETRGYADYLSDLQKQANTKIRSGLFGSADSFAVRSISKSASIYKELEGLTPVVNFSGGIESVTTWRITDLFLLVFALVAGIQLLTQERSEGFIALFRPAKNGHARLYIKKYLAMLVFVISGFILLYGSNLLVASTVYGLGDLTVPVQSVYGMQACPYPISISTYLVFFFAEKLLWLLAAASLVFLICGFFRRANYVLLACAVMSGLFMAMGASSSLWLRSLSLAELSDTNGLFNCCLLLSFFASPVRHTVISMVFCAALTLSCFCGGLAYFCKHAIIAKTTRKLPSVALFPNRHVGLFRHEAHKLLIVNRGALILILFIVFQLFQYNNFYINNAPVEHYYRQYSLRLAGYPDEEKDALISTEEAHFTEIAAKINQYAERFSEDESAFELATRELRQQLVPQEGFEKARNQYENLSDNAQYIYESGYDRLYNREGISDDLWNLLKLFFALVLALSSIFSCEFETGVNVLQRTSGRAGAIARRKIAVAGLVMILAMVIAFAPQYVSVINGYGLPQLGARASNIAIFSGIPDAVKLIHVLVLTNFIRLLLTVGACTLIALFSKRTRSGFATLLISCAALSLPLLIVILFFI